MRLARATEKPAKDYVPCPGCYRWYLSTQLGRHTKNCGYAEGDADCDMTLKRAKKIKNTIRQDEVLIDFANAIGETLHDTKDLQHIKVLRSRMRLLGRFLQHGQSIYPDLTIKSLMKNTEFEKIKEICKSVPVVEGSTTRTHMLIGFVLKHVIERQLFPLKTEEDNAERNQLITSLEYLSSSMGKPWNTTVNSAVAHRVAETNRNKRKSIVEEEDVKKVFRFTVTMVAEYQSRFEDQRTPESYRNLLEAVFSWTTLFKFR